MKWAMVIVLAAALAAAVTGWQRSARKQAEVVKLQEEITRIRAEAAAKLKSELEQRDQDLIRLESDAREVHRLRGEVRKLGSGAAEAATLRAENERLRALAERLGAAQPALPDSEPATEEDVKPLAMYPKEDWAFSGYSTPEDALVSAIWAMQQGDPRTYLDSLGPNEQVRIAERWQDKSEQEIAAKHQGDVARITGLEILTEEVKSGGEVVMDVRIHGVDRLEKVSMKQVDGQWRFDGYIRDDGQ